MHLTILNLLSHNNQASLIQPLDELRPLLGRRLQDIDLGDVGDVDQLLGGRARHEVVERDPKPRLAKLTEPTAYDVIDLDALDHLDDHVLKKHQIDERPHQHPNINIKKQKMSTTKPLPTQITHHHHEHLNNHTIAVETGLQHATTKQQLVTVQLPRSIDDRLPGQRCAPQTKTFGHSNTHTRRHAQYINKNPMNLEIIQPKPPKHHNPPK